MVPLIAMWRIALVLLVALQQLPSITITTDPDAARVLQLSANDVARLRSSGVLSTRKTPSRVPDIFFKYPVPQFYESNAKAHAELRAQGAPEREVLIGEWVSVFDAVDGGYWFGEEIANYEGEKGRGAIGFLSNEGRYTMFRLPALRRASISAILAEPDAIWAGMYLQQERAQTAMGLLRYDRKSKTTRTFAVPVGIHTIVRADTRLFMGTERGPYMLRGDTVTRLLWK